MAIRFQGAVRAMRRLRMPACLMLLAPLTINPSPVPSPAPPPAVSAKIGTMFVDSVLVADIGGNGNMLQVEFYHRGPLPAENKHSRVKHDEYVRGVEIATGDGIKLDRWEAPPTTRPCMGKVSACFSQLDHVWAAPPGATSLITAAVLYGKRTLRLWAFRWSSGKLEQVGSWQGEDFSIGQLFGHLTVNVRPLDNKLPQLYAWNGTTFVEASHEMPAYYSALGESYSAAISGRKTHPADLVRECQLVLQAYDIAHHIEAGRDACDKAKQRLKSGQGVVPSSGRISPQRFESEKLAALGQIDDLLRQYPESLH
ncbi:MAG TPA: hypothetical protein VJN94_07955 [Candidatus Binataceae bacterium]|nr:hypothetical protein [Candidatus Binataceae bacterium]